MFPEKANSTDRKKLRIFKQLVRNLSNFLLRFRAHFAIILRIILFR